MSETHHTAPFVYFHPDDPAGRLKPDEPLLVDGLDWSWVFVVYRPIPEHPGYCVGSNGLVWSCLEHAGPGKCVLTDRWHWMKPHPNRRGHLRVFLGQRNDRFVHHIVLESFVSSRPTGLECRHLDGDPTNNRINNLKWGTYADNREDMVRHGRVGKSKGEANGRSVLTAEVVREILALRAVDECIAAIGRRLGVGKSAIRAILRGDTWRHVSDVVGLPPYQVGEARDEKHASAVLTESDVREAMERHRSGESSRQIAEKLGVHRSTITAILDGKSWRQVTGLTPTRRVNR